MFAGSFREGCGCLQAPRPTLKQVVQLHRRRHRGRQRALGPLARGAQAAQRARAAGQVHPRLALELLRGRRKGQLAGARVRVGLCEGVGWALGGGAHTGGRRREHVGGDSSCMGMQGKAAGRLPAAHVSKV